jgi:hypothetical protein
MNEISPAGDASRVLPSTEERAYPASPQIFVQAGEYRGEGRSRGLCRGLLPLANGENITREGMGIGCPVLVSRGNTIFSRTCTIDQQQDPIKCTFLLDTSLGWGVTGHPSVVFTRLVNGIVNLYMHHPVLQPLLPIGTFFRSLLSIRPVWSAITPVAEARCTYSIDGSAVEIICRIQSRDKGLPIIFLLNEAGADAFVAAWSGDRVVDPPCGWEPYPLPEERWLYDPSRKLHFRITIEEVSEGLTADLFWGREQAGDLCWAGYGIRMIPQRPLPEASCRYTVAFNQEHSP